MLTVVPCAFSLLLHPQLEVARSKNLGTRLLFTPTSGFIGTTTFGYRSTDDFDDFSNLATVTVTVTNGSVHGDPHVVKWNGERYMYHGQCDLVMFRNPVIGLHLHIRTTIQEDSWSYVEAMALQVGPDILELSNYQKVAQIKFNDKVIAHDSLPFKFGQEDMFSVDTSVKKLVTHENEKVTERNVYNIQLGPKGLIEVALSWVFVSVSVKPKGDMGSNTSGLMGTFPSGELVARNGTVTFSDTDTDTYGGHWQVNPEEGDPMLFSEARDPVWPSPCKLPALDYITGRRLDPDILNQAHVDCESYYSSDGDIEDCVYDELMTGNMMMAGAW